MLSSTLLKIIKASSYLIFISPLIVGTSYFFPFVAPKAFWMMFFCQLMFFSWLILIFIDKNYRPKISIIFLAVFIFIFSLFLSTIFSVAPSLSFWSNSERMTGFLFFLHLFCFFIVLSSVFKKEELENLLFFINLVGLTIVIFTFLIPSGREGGTLGNSSFWGTTVLIIALLTLYLIFSSKRMRNFLIFSLILMAIFLFINQARAAKVSFVLGTFLFLLFYFSFVFPNKKIQKLGLFLLILSFLIGIFVFYLLFIPDSLPRKLLEKATDRTFGGRFIVWRVVLDRFWERPFFGWGLETLDFIFFKGFNPCLLSADCGGEIWYDRAHNVVLDLLTSAGLFGVFSYFLIFLACLYGLYKRARTEKKEFLNFFFFFSLFFAYFLQGMTVFDMPVSYLLLFFIFAFINVLSFPKKEEFFEEKKISPFPLIFVLILGAFSFYYFIFLPMLSNRAVLSCIGERRIDKLSVCNKVNVSSFGNVHSWETIASLQTMYESKEISLAHKKKLEIIKDNLERNVSRYPLKFRSQFMLASVLRMLAGYDLKYSKPAYEQITKVIKMNPSHPLIYIELSLWYLQEGKKEDALKAAQEALRLTPNSKFLNNFFSALKNEN